MCIFRNVHNLNRHSRARRVVTIYLGCQYIRVGGFFLEKIIINRFIDRINIELEEIFLFQIWILSRS